MMRQSANDTLASYIEAVASGAPTPGGGSVVAVVAALAAGLGEMVCNLTLGRPAYAAAEVECQAAKAQLEALRARLLAAAGEDEAAYRDYRAATALPKGNDEEQGRRAAAIQSALTTATDVPLAVAVACIEVAETLEPVARLGNRHALSDARIGALLAGAALRGALLNVSGNAAMLRDAAAATAYRERADELERLGTQAVQRVLDRASDRAAT